MWSTRLPNFCLGAKDPPAPPPPPPYLSSAIYVLFYCKFALRTWLQNSSDFHIGSERALACKRAKERFGLGVKTENEFDENELVIRDVRLGVHLFCLWFFLEYYSWCGFSSRCS